jgi:hypothetical protein
MLRHTTKYTPCTTNFLLIQGKILGLAPPMATAYFHYTRNYFVSRTLILWTAEHMINHSALIREMVKTFFPHENGNETFYLISILLSINISTPKIKAKDSVSMHND